METSTLGRDFLAFSLSSLLPILSASIQMRGVGGNSQGFAPSFLPLCHSLERGEGDVSHTRICSSLSGALQSIA